MTDHPPTVATAAVPRLSRLGAGQRALDWSKQPSTQEGLSLMMAALVLAAIHPFPSAQAIAATLLAASLPKLWPDNTTDAIRTRDVSNAIAHAAATRQPVDLEQAAASVAELLDPQPPVRS